MAEQDWARFWAALASAGAQARVAATALGSAGHAFAEAGGTLLLVPTKAGCRVAWAVAEDLYRSLSAQADEVRASADFVPVAIMFTLALVAVILALACACPARRRGASLVHVLAVPLAAAFIALPGAADILYGALMAAAAVATNAAAEVHPSAPAALASLGATWATAASLATAASNASRTFGAQAFEILQAQGAFASVSAAMASEPLQRALHHPHWQVTQSHQHFGSFVQGLWGLLGVVVSVWLLRCGGCLGRNAIAPKAAAKDKANPKSATNVSKGGEFKGGKAAAKRSAKGSAKGGGGGRLRGVGEGELRSDEELAGPSMLSKVLAPLRAGLGAIVGVGRLVVSLFSLVGSLGRGGGRAADGVEEDDEEDDEATTDAAGGGSSANGANGVKAAAKKKPPKIEEITHPRLLATLKGFTEGISAAALSSDGDLAVGASTDRTMRFFSALGLAGKEALPPPLVHHVAATRPGVGLDHGVGCSFSSDLGLLVLGTAQSRRLLTYTLAPAKAGSKLHLQPRKEMPAKGGAAHPRPVSAALAAPNGRFVVSVGAEDDRTIKLWSTAGELVCSVDNKQAAQYGASISADSRLIAVAAAAHGGSHSASRAVAPRHAQVSVYEVVLNGESPVGLRLVLSVAGHIRGISAVAFSSLGCNHLALAAKDGAWTVVKTDVPALAATKEEAKELGRGHVRPGFFERLALSPLARRLIGATATTMSIVDVGTAAVLETISTGHGVTSSLAMSADGLRVLTAGEDGKLRLWRVEGKQ